MFDDLRDLYQEVILDHGRRPRNTGHPEATNRRADGHNPLCGDKLSLYLTVVDGVAIATEAETAARSNAVGLQGIIARSATSTA